MRKYKFSGHQTFAFRYGWLEKGARAVAECPTALSEPDALVRLGVGKNMVSSIKHWCLATQMVEPAPNLRRSTTRVLRPTRLGERLLVGGNPWDPFLEHDGSLWLLHWLLVSNPEIGSSWQLLFSQFHRPDFSKRELIAFILGFAERRGLKVKESVVARDVECFLHTYVTGAASQKLSTPEEGYACPLLGLGLIQSTPDGEYFRFAIGPKPGLPTPVFGFALCQYLERSRAGRQTLSIQDCLYGEDSPGQAFKLDENSLVTYVESLHDLTSGSLSLDETAGLKQIYVKRGLDAIEVLSHMYGGGS